MELEISDGIASGVCRELGMQFSSSAFLTSRTDEDPAEVQRWIELNAPANSPERRVQVSQILDAVIHPERVIQVRIRESNGELRTISLCRKAGKYFPVRVTSNSTRIGRSIDGSILVESIKDLIFIGAGAGAITEDAVAKDIDKTVPIGDALAALAFNCVGLREGECDRDELQDLMTASLSAVGIHDSASLAHEYVSAALDNKFLEADDGGLRIGSKGQDKTYRSALFARSVAVTSVDPERLDALDTEGFTLAMADATKLFVGSEIPFLLTFGDSSAELSRMNPAAAEAVLSIHVSGVAFPSTMPKLARNGSSRPTARHAAPFRFVSSYELAILCEGAMLEGVVDPEVLFFPQQVVGLSLRSCENREPLFVNVSGDVAAAWVPADSGVGLHEFESAQVESVVADAITAWLEPFDVTHADGTFTIKSAELTEPPSKWLSAPAAFAQVAEDDWIQLALSNHRAVGQLIAGVELEAIAAPGAGIWVFMREEADGEVILIPHSVTHLLKLLFAAADAEYGD